MAGWSLEAAAKRVLPVWAKQRLKAALGRGPAEIPLGSVSFGDLRRTEPISRGFGYARGRPVDRYYIEGFLAAQAKHIHGRVLEIGDNSYTRAFGGDRVSLSDVLHVHPGHPGATFVGNLEDAQSLPSDAFDCIILTQTLHLVFDLRGAFATLYRILKPGGVLLATVPGISQISDINWGDSWYWSLTSRSLRRLAEAVFSADAVEVESHGNVLSAIAFLQGLADSELTSRELRVRDEEYQLVVTLVATKRA